LKTKNIKQTIIFKTSPQKIYESLMNSKSHSTITNSKARIGNKVGSSFGVWGGAVNGITISLSRNKRIVQAWRTEEWPKEHYSIAVFNLEKIENGTKLIFEHYAVPAEDYKNISENWKACYWNPMKKIFGPK
jgi:activator of HSP90 ATPase